MWIAAIEELLDDPGEYESAKRNIEAVRPQYEWPNAVSGLVRLASGQRAHGVGLRRTEAMLARYVWLSVVGAVIKRGFRGAFKRAIAMLREPRVP
jgi:hypothetical protein